MFKVILTQGLLSESIANMPVCANMPDLQPVMGLGEVPVHHRFQRRLLFEDTSTRLLPISMQIVFDLHFPPRQDPFLSSFCQFAGKHSFQKQR